MRLKVVVATFISVLFCSCYSYRLTEQLNSADLNSLSTIKQEVYVLNPDLEQEYDILKRANIYDLSTDSLCDTKIRLQPISTHYFCGNALIPYTLFLGQIPAVFYDTHRYSWEEVRRDSTVTQTFNLQLTKRMWFWDAFNKHKNWKVIAAMDLRQRYFHR